MNDHMWKEMDKAQKKKILNKIDIGGILNQLHDGLSICNSSGEILYVTESYEDIYGESIDNVLGKTNEEITTTKNAISERVLKEGKKITTKQENRFGREMFVTGVPIYNKHNEIEYAVVYNSWEVNNEDELFQKYNHLENENKRLQTEINALNTFSQNNYEYLMAESESMREVIKIIERAAKQDIPVFISGERGTGKRYIAGYLHHLSDRKNNKVMFFDSDDVCGISVDEALFGSCYQSGILEICDKGTVIIKGVENINFSLQNKLASFIKSRFYRTLDAKEIHSDVKIIFISNLSAQKLLELGMISRNLFYQVGIMDIIIPPIRERMDDIELYINYYLENYNNKYGKNVTLSNKAKSLLMSYEWGDNIREIKFVMEQIVISNDNKEISSYELPEIITEGYYKHVEEIRDLKSMLEFYEAKIITQTYKRCKTSVAVAKELNISQASASRKIQKYVGTSFIQK